MANNAGNPSQLSRVINLVRLERKDITSVYFFALLKGLILLAVPVGIQTLIGFAQTNTASSSIVLLIIMVVVSVLAGGIMQVKQMEIIEKIQQSIFVKYAFEIGEKIQHIKLAAVDRYYLPELANRFFDIINLQKGLAKLLLDFPLAIIQIVLGLMLLTFYHPAFIAFGVFLILVIGGILYFSGSKGLQKSIEESTRKYKLAGWIEEMARVIRSVKFARTPDFVTRKTDKHITEYLLSRTGHFNILKLQFSVLVAFKTLVTSAMLLVGTYLLLNQQLNVGQFIAAEIVVLTVISSVEKLIFDLDAVYDVLTAVEKIQQITGKETETGGSLQLPAIPEGVSVSLKNVSYTYPEKNIPVLQDVSFNVAANDKVCISGGEGSGKSTLLRLIAAGFDDAKGSILINEVPMKNYSLQSLRLNTGVLISEQDIFEGTLLENICFGIEDIKMEEIIELGKKTGLLDFVNTLEMGFDHMIYDVGRKLPGHAVKKILLMRALINKPRLLLLEEPWTGLEEKHQEMIKQYLLNETSGSTLFVITNDTQFKNACDKVITLTKNGTIADNK